MERPRGDLCEGSIVRIVSQRSAWLGRYGFVYKEHKSGRFGVMLEGSMKISYTKAGIKLVLPEDECVRADECATAKEARDAYFEPPNDDTFNFIPRVSPETVPGASAGSPFRTAGTRHGRTNAASLDLEELTRVLDALQRSVYALSEGTANSVNRMESNMSLLLNRIETLESRLNSGRDTTQDGYRTPDVIPETDTDYNMALGSQ